MNFIEHIRINILNSKLKISKKVQELFPGMKTKKDGDYFDFTWDYK